jgi:serine/threonine protein kinase
VNVSILAERSRICDSDEVSNQIYHRIEDDFLVFMKSVALSGNVKESEIEHEIERMINLRHHCIAGQIGFVFRIESGIRKELQIVRLYLEGCSLSEVVSVHPVWWTSTVKAKAVAFIVLALRFAHTLGLVHGHLTTSNILFDCDHCIQIVDFKSMRLEVGSSESERGSEERTQLVGCSEERWTPKRDIQAFASILFELLFGSPPHSESSITRGIPNFVSRIIESDLSPICETSYSFNTILTILKENNFQIEDGVDPAEVSEFVNWVESAGYPDK